MNNPNMKQFTKKDVEDLQNVIEDVSKVKEQHDIKKGKKAKEFAKYLDSFIILAQSNIVQNSDDNQDPKPDQGESPAINGNNAPFPSPRGDVNRSEIKAMDCSVETIPVWNIEYPLNVIKQDPSKETVFCEDKYMTDKTTKFDATLDEKESAWKELPMDVVKMDTRHSCDLPVFCGEKYIMDQLKKFDFSVNDGEVVYYELPIDAIKNDEFLEKQAMKATIEDYEKKKCDEKIQIWKRNKMVKRYMVVMKMRLNKENEGNVDENKKEECREKARRVFMDFMENAKRNSDPLSEKEVVVEMEENDIISEFNQEMASKEEIQDNSKSEIKQEKEIKSGKCCLIM